MPAERKHTRPPFPLTGKKIKPFLPVYGLRGTTELVTAVRTRFVLLAPRVSDMSFSHLLFSPLPSRYTVMRNKISPLSQCVGSEAFILLDCLFYVSSLALRRD